MEHFINVWDEGIEKVAVKLTEDTKLAGTVSITETRVLILNDSAKLEKWSEKEKYEIK